MAANLSPQQPPRLILSSRPGEPARVLEPGKKHRIDRRMVDICFVFDTTGSMSDKRDGLIQCLIEFVDELARLALDWRVTVVPFGDLTVEGDVIVGSLPFVADPESASRLLTEMVRNGGGGNGGESSLEAMLAALAKPYRAGAVKVFVLLTDEPALTDRSNPAQIEAALRLGEVVTFVASPDLPYFRRWAEITGGAWYDIDSYFDYSGVLGMLKGLVQQVARVAAAVHTLAQGSVAQYLELPPGRRELPP
jgi:hypothetical protein